MITCQRENAGDLWEEVMPLLRAHWAEVAKWPDIPLDPDRDGYDTIERWGQLRCYTARLENKQLIGYAAFFLKPNIHYKGSLQAWQDVLYVDPRWRANVGVKLIRYCECALAAEKAQVVYHHAKVINQFGPLLRALGYELVDEIYGKRVDRERD